MKFLTRLIYSVPEQPPEQKKITTYRKLPASLFSCLAEVYVMSLTVA